MTIVQDAVASAGTKISPPAIDRRARFLPWIAAERFVRGLILIAAGIVLLTHMSTDWGGVVRRFAVRLGVDPTRHLVANTIEHAQALSPHKVMVFGLIALGYGILEGVEGGGLLLKRRWAEYLTVWATAVFIPLELWEISRHPSLLKIGGLIVNVAIVVYLARMLKRNRHAG